MAIERTFSIVKPDAFGAGNAGNVLQAFNDAGLRPIAFKTMWLTKAQAEGFYAEHNGRGFFAELVEFMSSGPCVVQVLEGESAIAKNRELMGATDSREAAPGTIRAKYGTDKGKNAVHGSDSPAAAAREIAFFFSAAELAALGN